MSENTLDRLDRDPGGARQYIATLIVVGGASNAQIAKQLHDKFNVREPTPRIVSHWRNHDPALIALVDELEAVKRDVAPDADLDGVLAKLPAPVDPAVAAETLLSMSIVSRPFAELVVAGPEEGVSKVLAAGHTTAADFDAHCAALTADYEPPEDEDALSSGGFYGG